MSYNKVGWKDGAEGRTPVSSQNLGHMDEGILEAHQNIGELNQLDTKATGSLVEAVNETLGRFDDVNTEIEDLKKSVSDGKSIVASAITAKGVETAEDASFQTMATNIAAITTDGNVQTVTRSGSFVLNRDVNYIYAATDNGLYHCCQIRVDGVVVTPKIVMSSGVSAGSGYMGLMVSRAEGKFKKGQTVSVTATIDGGQDFVWA